MKYIAIVGSNSEYSTNRMLLEWIKHHYSNKMTVELMEIADLRPFDRCQNGLDIEELQDKVLQIKQAAGVIISTPEYDHSIPAVLSNALVWFSVHPEQPFKDKPVLVIGASYGKLGAVRAQTHLRHILDAPNIQSRVMPNIQFCLGNSLQAFDEEGDLKDEKKIEQLDDVIDKFQRFTSVSRYLEKSQ